MVLHSYGFFCGEGNWSKYVTVRDAFSGDPSTFLGSVLDNTDLPATVNAAKSLWHLSVDPVVADTCFVESDSGHNGNPCQYIIESINNGNIAWKYMYSIPIPSGNFQLLTNMVQNFTSADETHYPSAKAVNDLVGALSSELALLDSVPNIIKVVYDEDVSTTVITVGTDKPLPVTHKLVVTSLKTGRSQVFITSWNGNTCTLTFSDPVVTPFLVAIEKI